MKFLAFILATLSFTTFAATTGTLNLSGVVPVDYQIVVDPESAASTLDIVNGETSTKVADVTEITNNPSGYKVTLQASGELTNGASSVAYTLSYDGNVVDPDGTVQTAKTSATEALTPGNVSEVTITFTGLGSSAVAGTYSDSVVFEIGAP